MKLCFSDLLYLMRKMLKLVNIYFRINFFVIFKIKKKLILLVINESK